MLGNTQGYYEDYMIILYYYYYYKIILSAFIKNEINPCL